MNFKPLGNPLLILCDSPDGLGGLSRIGRDLASLLCTLPQFRVGYLGRGGVGRRKFPWTQYSYPEAAGWGQDHIAPVWHDFSGGEDGIIFSLWDASRMLWFGQPQTNPNPELAKFLGEGRNFQKWGYFPVDGDGPSRDSLPQGMAAAIAGYDRVLSASEWGGRRLSLIRPDADWIPHGIWMDKFGPKKWEPMQPKAAIGWDESGIYVGCNMANQARKDWPVAFECAVALKQKYGNRFRFWAHTDQMIHYWNMYALATDYGMGDQVEITLDLTDEEMALRYAACDCTILPSGGEGFGFPVAESLACGTACIVADYAAAQELVEEECRVRPLAYRIDTQHNVKRAVLSGYGFAQKAIEQIEKKRSDWEFEADRLRSTVEHLSWVNLKTVWEKWLLAGLK